MLFNRAPGGRLVVGVFALLALAMPAVASARFSQPAPPAPRLATVGVTVDDVSHLSAVIASLRALPRRPTVRIVLDIDPARPAATARWRHAIARLHRVGTVMGELADSSELKRITVDGMRRRAAAFVGAYGDQVGVWEIGNEVNGSWTGRPALVARKTIAAYDAIHAARGRTALTLYENRHCGDGPDEARPASWSRANLPARVRRGVNEVLLSYYEDQCHGHRPSAATWRREFMTRHRLFPNAQLGFGEIGLARPAIKRTEPAARSLIRHYYRLQVAVPGWIGGCFWWYFAEDMVPWRSSPLWRTLDDVTAR